jgi:hypothetical protein
MGATILRRAYAIALKARVGPRHESAPQKCRMMKWHGVQSGAHRTRLAANLARFRNELEWLGTGKRGCNSTFSRDVMQFCLCG